MIDTDTEATDDEDDPNEHTDEDSEAMNYNMLVLATVEWVAWVSMRLLF